jgi:hypothetical protein
VYPSHPQALRCASPVVAIIRVDKLQPTLVDLLFQRSHVQLQVCTQPRASAASQWVDAGFTFSVHPLARPDRIGLLCEVTTQAEEL